MRLPITLFIAFALLLLAGCVSDQQSSNNPPAKMEVVMYKSPYCGCCVGYKEYLEQKGYKVKVVEMEDISSIKEKYNIPYNYRSCHTTIFGNYFVEGHVPIEAVEKLLSEKPDIDGITLPGMPAGSPGMSGIKTSPFRVFSLKDGNPEVFDEV